jgi:nitroreductase
MTNAPFDLAETDRLLSTTRAVRRRLDLARPVPRDVILDCIRLAQQAPTGSNSQGWRFVVVDDPALRKGLAALYKKAADAYLPLARGRLSESDVQTKRVYDSAFWLVEHLAEVPVHVVPCHAGRPASEGGNIAGASFYGSIFPAVWSFQLALRSRGLGSALTTLHLLHEREAAELLGLDFDRVTQVALLPVAWTRGADFRPAERPDPASITAWNAGGLASGGSR